MKIKFLGTAAAEGIPGIFCTCDLCTKARLLKGKNIRSRFSVMIDDAYKIDFPPDSFYHMVREGLDFTKVNHLFISHPHTDHLYRFDFEFRRQWFTNLRGENKLNIYGWKKSLDLIKEEIESTDINYPIFHEVIPFNKMDCDDFFVYTLPANHMRENDKPYIYLFQRKIDNKCFLCAHDTGVFSEEVWNFLKSFKLDVVSIDCTHGSGYNYNNHLGATNVCDVKKRLEEENIFNNGIFIANHFSHNGKWTHEELEEFFSKHNILVAYDGMVLEF